MGRTAHDPVRMIKLAFLQFHSTLSDREVPVCVPRGSDWMTLGSLVMERSAEPVLHFAPGPPADTPYSEIRFE